MAGGNGDTESPELFAMQWHYGSKQDGRLILEQTPKIAGQRLENLPEIGRVSLLGEEVSVYHPAQNVPDDAFDVYRLRSSDLSITVRTDDLSQQAILQIIAGLGMKK